MIESIWVINQNGERLDLNLRSSNLDHGLLIYNLTGIGSPSANVNSEGGPNFDGVEVNSITVDPRSIDFTIAVQHSGAKEVHAKELIYKFFPLKQTITFGILVNSVDLCIEAIVEENEYNQFAKVENAVISLFCPNPYFMETRERIYILPADRVHKRFSFPYMNNSLDEDLTQFGSIEDWATAEVLYHGGVTTGFNMSIGFTNWPWTPITIRNNNGPQEFVIDMDTVETIIGEAVAIGDRIDLNTKIGEKGVQFYNSSTGQLHNILSAIDMDQDWIEIRSGVNAFTLIGPYPLRMEGTIRFNGLRQGV